MSRFNVAIFWRATSTALIRQLLTLCGNGAELVGAQEREWASATFAGARHIVDLLMPAGDLGRLATLPDHEFTLAGEIVADCSVAIGRCESDGADRQPVRVELLTINAD